MTRNIDRMSSTKPYGPNVKMTCGPHWSWCTKPSARPYCHELRPAKTGRQGSVRQPKSVARALTKATRQPAERPAGPPREPSRRRLVGGYFEMHPAVGLLLRRGSWERHLQTLAAQVSGAMRCCRSVTR